MALVGMLRSGLTPPKLVTPLSLMAGALSQQTACISCLSLPLEERDLPHSLEYLLVPGRMSDMSIKGPVFCIRAG